MVPADPSDVIKVVAARVIDLRSEFEAQLRAVARLEDQLAKRELPKNQGWRVLEEVLRRELAEMLRNNSNIRDVLNQLDADIEPGGVAVPIS